MKMITFSKLRQLALAALCTCGVSANAQFTGTATQYINSTYENIAVEFKMSEVATALGSDTATVRATLDAFMENGASDACTFSLKLADGTTSTNYTQGSSGGFWVGQDGKPMDYGTGCVWFNLLSYATGADAEGNVADEFDIVFGQYPEAFTNDTVIKPSFILAMNGKEVTFDITYNINKVPDAPVPTTILKSQLNIVGTATTTASRYTNQGYDGLTLSVPAAEVIEKLGADKSLFKAQMPSLMYTEWLDATDGTIKDSLTNTTTAGTAPGWWYKKSVYPQGHEKQGESAPDVAATGYGDTDIIFMEAFSYDADADAITCNMGQYPGVPVEGDSVSANVYVIYGDKAYKLNYQVLFTEAPAKGLADMTSVGNYDVNITKTTDDGDYAATNVTLDVEAIASALGCATSAINMTTLKDETSLYVGEGTANNGGFWIDADGFACNWSAGASFFEPTTTGDYSSINFGLHPQVKTNVGTTYSGKIYFTNESNYYTVSYNIAITKKELAVGEKDWTVANKHAAVVQVIASASEYLADGNQTTYTLTDEQIQADIATGSYVMYGDLADSLVTDSTLYGKHSTYACTPAPGIWFNENGKCSGYNGTQTVGICYGSDGAFTVYQMPGKNASGTSWSGNIYFVNEETGKMSQVAFTVQFVDELKQAEIVGTEDITIAVKGDDERTAAIDLSKPAEALGLTAKELIEGSYAKGMTASGLYGNASVISTGGLNFDFSGNYTADGAISIAIIQDEETGAYLLDSYSMNTIASDFKATAKFCFEANDKQYVYNLTLVSDEIYAGISDVKAISNKSGKLYDLSGRLVVSPAKGLYIKDGKKFVIK